MPNRRKEPRTIINNFYSLQFYITGLKAVYQFKLWDISSHGMCILVDKDSEVLPYLKVGEVFKIKYYPQAFYDQTRLCWTQIRHLTAGDGHRFKGFFLVGLEILD